ncbi:hypothetical protein AVEN_74050-1 [Araneus ventricosus]|uniref:Uncharacterized protein n=1 Tax=Araneus ventricosus TaxID=182803 RepID=A0A4Y2SHR4_ARAVE|nr:hypothetical protein AVEN_22939-1 [Araneus ventricosus]GBN65787.1 hypothetical protein AVEN_223712-1 [Araneus ventricosus]GBN87431.1 hypothetical protein AVEN_74050-1 [Araneus ventricosus]
MWFQREAALDNSASYLRKYLNISGLSDLVSKLDQAVRYCGRISTSKWGGDQVRNPIPGKFCRVCGLSDVTSPLAGVAQKFGDIMRYEMSSSSSWFTVTTVQNGEASPKIDLMLL